MQRSQYWESSKPKLVEEIRVGIPDDFFWHDVDGQGLEVCRLALAKLQEIGAVLVEVATGDLIAHHRASSTAIAFYEGRMMLEGFLASQGAGRSFRELAESVAAPDVQSILLDQLNTETAVSHEEYAQAISYHRPALQDAYRRMFRDNALDVLAFPTSPIAAPLIGEDVEVTLNGRELPAFPTIIRNTDVGSNAGLPGITIPAGHTATGLPVGLAFDAPPGADRILLDAAIGLQAHFPALVPAPTATASSFQI